MNYVDNFLYATKYVQVKTGNEENLPIIVTIVTKGQIYCKSFPKKITICW